jgi:hypothetical protein
MAVGVCGARRSFHHPNRFVRETCHHIMASLAHVLQGEQLLQVALQMAPRLADGLSDSWSQVGGCGLWPCGDAEVQRACVQCAACLLHEVHVLDSDATWWVRAWPALMALVPAGVLYRRCATQRLWLCGRFWALYQSTGMSCCLTSLAPCASTGAWGSLVELSWAGLDQCTGHGCMQHVTTSHSATQRCAGATQPAEPAAVAGGHLDIAAVLASCPAVSLHNNRSPFCSGSCRWRKVSAAVTHTWPLLCCYCQVLCGRRRAAVLPGDMAAGNGQRWSQQGGAVCGAAGGALHRAEQGQQPRRQGGCLRVHSRCVAGVQAMCYTCAAPFPYSAHACPLPHTPAPACLPAELMEKIDPSAVRPHVEPLLRALLLCFKDLGWPVRDAACSALGR